MRSFLVGPSLLFLAALIVVPHGALAACTMTTSQPSFTLTECEGCHVYYLVIINGCHVNDCPGGYYPFADFIYEETNNVAGLQRHDAVVDDVCDRDGYADLQIV